jgi:hypothetical protein
MVPKPAKIAAMIGAFQFASSMKRNAPIEIVFGV